MQDPVFIPQEPMPDWYGRKPGPHLKPLTPEFFKAAKAAGTLRMVADHEIGVRHLGLWVIGIAIVVVLGFAYGALSR